MKLKTFIIMCTIIGSSVAHGQDEHQGCVHSKGYAAHDSEGGLVPFEFQRKEVGDHDILIEILYSGICHSDIHYVNNDWGRTVYPIVPGHEIAGQVVKVGKEVTKFSVGDYAGVGCMVNSCGVCKHCKAGHEQFCENGTVFTYQSKDRDGDITQGGYANNIVVNEHFGIKIPQDAPLEKIAPLLCAGITTYSPIHITRIKAGDKVAIGGFGGLGHMALQYLVKLGAEVTVFDLSEEKRSLAMEMGAAKYVNVNNMPEMEGMENSFRAIFCTIDRNYDLDKYMGMLEIDGQFVMIGLPPTEDSPALHTGKLGYRRVLWKSLIGGIPETQEMLDYSIANNIYPMVEVIPADYVNEAYRRVKAGDVHFRFVIDMSTLR